jgi:excisionase family DNA binding protein
LQDLKDYQVNKLQARGAGTGSADAGRCSGTRRRRPETRDELLSRLLDPVLTLEETALMLEVCPATVRRYTNRGILEHERSQGNQRRFRLSSVLAFLKANRSETTLPTISFSHPASRVGLSRRSTTES